MGCIVRESSMQVGEDGGLFWMQTFKLESDI